MPYIKQSDIDYSVTKHDFTNSTTLTKLYNYSRELTPTSTAVFDDLLEGRAVLVSRIHSAMEPLFQEVLKHMKKDGESDHSKFAELERLLSDLGRQL